MFCGAEAFNQPIMFDTSQVTNELHMFEHAKSFNQPLDLISSVIYMRNVFMGKIIQSTLDFDSKVVNMSYVCSCKIIQSSTPI